MTEPDETFEDTRIGALYRRTATGEPPAAIDRAVLAAARAAVPRRRYRSPLTWAVAATLVLGVGIGWQVLRIDQDRVMSPAMPAVEARLNSGGPAAAPAQTPESAERTVPTGEPVDLAPKRSMHGATPAARTALETDRTGTSPVGAPIASGPRLQDECDDYDLADDAPAQAFRDAIDAARRAGDTRRARCLEQGLRLHQADPAEPAAIPQPAREE